jgi:integrase/recombinase XerD
MLPKINLKFFLYKARANKKTGEVPIYYKLKLDATGEEKHFSTGFFIKEKDWKNGQVYGKKEKAAEANHYITNLNLKVKQLYNKFISKEEDFTLNDFIAELSGKKTKVWGLVEYFGIYNKNIEKGIGRDYISSTFKKFEYLKNHVQNFIEKRYERDDYPLSKLDHNFIEDFYFYMRNDIGHEPTTLHKEIQRLKQIVLNAFARNLISRNPFILFKNPVPETEIIFLNEEELKKLEDKVFDIPRLNLIKDLFLFSCYTGLAFAEIHNATKENIQIGIDGKKWIVGYRQKTIREKNQYNVPLLPQALQILDKYKGDLRTIEKGKLLPVPAVQTYNAYLKEIATICNINKELTTHVARKTFATTVTLLNDVPLHIVSAMLAHSDTKITEKIYAKVVPKGISQSMMTLEQKLIASNS